MRQHCTSAPFELSLCVVFSVSVFLDLFICNLFLNSLKLGVLNLELESYTYVFLFVNFECLIYELRTQL